MITPQDIFDRVKSKLDVEDTDIYDDDILDFIESAMFKLKVEGVPVPAIDEEWLAMYITCVAFAVTLNLFTDVDVASVYERYSNNVTTLRLVVDL